MRTALKTFTVLHWVQAGLYLLNSLFWIGAVIFFVVIAQQAGAPGGGGAGGPGMRMGPGPFGNQTEMVVIYAIYGTGGFICLVMAVINGYAAHLFRKGKGRTHLIVASIANMVGGLAHMGCCILLVALPIALGVVSLVFLLKPNMTRLFARVRDGEPLEAVLQDEESKLHLRDGGPKHLPQDAEFEIDGKWDEARPGDGEAGNLDDPGGDNK